MSQLPIEEVLLIYKDLLDGMGIFMPSKRELLARYVHNICSRELCLITDNIQMSMLILNAINNATLTDNPDDVPTLEFKFDFDTNNYKFPRNVDKIEAMKQTIMKMLTKKFLNSVMVIFSIIDDLKIIDNKDGKYTAIVTSKLNEFNTSEVNTQYQRYKQLNQLV